MCKKCKKAKCVCDNSKCTNCNKAKCVCKDKKTPAKKIAVKKGKK